MIGGLVLRDVTSRVEVRIQPQTAMRTGKLLTRTNTKLTTARAYFRGISGGYFFILDVRELALKLEGLLYLGMKPMNLPKCNEQTGVLFSGMYAESQVFYFNYRNVPEPGNFHDTIVKVVY